METAPPDSTPSRSLHDISVHVTCGKVQREHTMGNHSTMSMPLGVKIKQWLARPHFRESQLSEVCLPLLTVGKIRLVENDVYERIEIKPCDLLTPELAERLLKDFCGSLRASASKSAPPPPVEEAQSPFADSLPQSPFENNAPQSRTHAALMRAAVDGRAATLTLLLEDGVDPNSRFENRWTPLMLAAWNGHHEAVRTLIAFRADLEARGDDGWNALIIAAWNGHLEIVKTCVANGADVNARDERGKTVLMWAAQKGSPEIVEFLLSRPIHVGAQNSRGMSALAYAEREGHPKIIALLKKAGAAP